MCTDWRSKTERERIAHPFCLGDNPSRGLVVINECYVHFKCMASLDKHSSNHL